MRVPVTPFVGKTHGDPAIRPCRQFLDQAVFVLTLPFVRHERLNFGTPREELGTVSPLTALCVDLRH